jgi:uncharacterized SAM-binding protein YcdF (DUF218 family)
MAMVTRFEINKKSYYPIPLSTASSTDNQGSRPMQPLTDTQLGQILWDYHYLGQQPTNADCIMGLGSDDLRVADRCANLYHEGFAPLIVFSGYLGNFTKGIYQEPEAHVFRKRALSLGVPAAAILIEDTATNTGGNIALTKQLLARQHIPVTSVLVVTKPNTQRRAYATAKKQWPEVNATILSPQITFANQPTALRSRTDIINEMVGDIQRIQQYPALGYQIAQDIPETVLAAYRELIGRGYTQHLQNH